MFFIRLLRFLRGYISFTASDGFPERFLNLCNQAGVVTWDIAWRGGAMHGKTDRRGYAAMQSCAPPAGIVLKARHTHGLPFFLYEYRRRAGMLAGLLVCAASLAVLSGMVWTIDVQGNERVAAEDILQVMEAQGLRLGVPRKSLDARAMSEIAQRQLPGVAWLSLNLRGSSAVIEVREELPNPPPPDDTPRNIVAAKAGQLKIIEVYNGADGARPGQAVFPGSILAGGAIENANATWRLVHADAYAVARTRVACESAVPRKSTARYARVGKTHYTLRFLGLGIPLGPRPKKIDGMVPMEDSFAWSPGGKRMPLSLERVSYFAVQPQERVKNDRQLLLTAAEAFFDKAYQTLRAAQVLEQEVAVALGEDGCTITLSGTAYENIGVAQGLD